MPKIKANNITINYEQQGTGEPLLLIPYLAADDACYAFQVADYAKQFTCISLDPRGAGESDKPGGTWSTELCGRCRLRGLGLQQYLTTFRNNAVDAEVLTELSAIVLKGK